MREMRRKDRALTEEEAWAVVERCSYGVLTMTAEDGTPYGVPLNYARDGGVLYFHSATEGKKTDALRKDPRVTLVCVERSDVVQEKYTTRFVSAMVFGKAEEVTETEEKVAGLRCICSRHAPEHMDIFDDYVAPRTGRTAVWKITAEHITGKANR